MNELNKLSKSLNQTLWNSNLQNVTSSLAETFSDNLLNNGILKDIPIIGTIVGLTKTAISLNDRLFLKKIIHFISEIKDVKPEKRKELIADIEKSEKTKIKVGEKLLYIIDKCNDHISAKYVAKLFNAFLKEEIKYSDFLRGSVIIQKMFVEDLEYFIETKTENLKKTITKYDDNVTDVENSLINSGLCGMKTDQVSIRDQDDWKMDEKYIVEGGGLVIYLTEIGYLMKKILK